MPVADSFDTSSKAMTSKVPVPSLWVQIVCSSGMAYKCTGRAPTETFEMTCGQASGTERNDSVRRRAARFESHSLQREA